jgi:Reverse transcriptase (RNA-dependent DNA polymerase)
MGFYEKELHAMECKGVCKIVPLSSLPHGRMLFCNRWVYTEKDVGTYRSRTVAQGYSQVPGKDFTYSHAPVMTDLAFRLDLIIKVLKKLRTGQFDLETAIFYSELDEVIYMRLPDGYVKYMLEVHNVKIDPSKMSYYSIKLSRAQSKLPDNGGKCLMQ